MPHINTEKNAHDHTASFYIIRTDTPQPSILLHKHRKIGKLMMFGGHIEIKENPWQTALHELVEETGYEPRQLQVLQPQNRITFLTETSLHPVPLCYSTKEYPGTPETHFHTDVTYAFVTSEEPISSPEDGESTDMRLFTLEELNAIPDDEVVDIYREIGRAILTTFVNDWEPVAFDQFS
jgi:8-oxo-dGTP pyrophosphatase MutT (NUDIX family)